MFGRGWKVEGCMTLCEEPSYGVVGCSYLFVTPIADGRTNPACLCPRCTLQYSHGQVDAGGGGGRIAVYCDESFHSGQFRGFDRLPSTISASGGLAAAGNSRHGGSAWLSMHMMMPTPFLERMMHTIHLSTPSHTFTSPCAFLSYQPRLRPRHLPCAAALRARDRIH